MMTTEAIAIEQPGKGLNLFERYLSVWVILCIVAGIILGKVAPGFAKYLDGLAIYVGEAPVVSIHIAICLFFMMYPIMVKIDFGEVVRAGKNVKPVALTLFVNWAIKPFTMYGISIFFLGTLFYGFIGPEAVDYVKMPLGLSLPLGANPRGRQGGAGGRRQDAAGSSLAELSCRVHTSRDRSMYCHGFGLGLSGPWKRRPHPGHGGH